MNPLTTYQVWWFCFEWLGESTVLPDIADVHFKQHNGSLSSTRGGMIRKILWASTAWNMWKIRNNCVFKEGIFDLQKSHPRYQILLLVLAEKLDGFIHAVALEHQSLYSGSNTRMLNLADP